MDRKPFPPPLMATSDIADWAEVGDSVVCNWANRDESFPKPAMHVARGRTPLYRRYEVISYVRARKARSLAGKVHN